MAHPRHLPRIRFREGRRSGPERHGHAVPVGFRLHRLGVPPGPGSRRLHRRRSPGLDPHREAGESAPIVVYDAPADGRRLQVFRVAEDTPAQSLGLAENDPGYGFSRRPGYQVIDRASGTTWAELAYRYDDTDLGARQVVDHRFRAADGRLYAIRATGPAALAPALVREPLTRALASFCPADTECGVGAE